ncbi:MAG TPA: T9SS type A sorting domain-containing protein [Bacteroidales bacterium]|jgi:hypothetical protein|nr:T9SS type A sorting domain-containing protein [Bacteroidales bacterium]HPB24125.1 T9SS type A sorting domain-containing protein [Bacteroidales bacterium]HQN14723.1 T9SS type A sorting domain-containing protein [Bacteroidales bacterium]HQP14417.1 T9SS type A sorting domain-containing protein [Bacteroidales bacterium]
MTVKKLTSCLLFLSALGLTTLQAQQSVNASGGNASGSGGSVSYSVGQAFYQTQTGTTGTVAEGVQQPYEISVVTAIEDAKTINLTVSVYPNPTTDYLTLEVPDFQLFHFTFSLYDMNGKLLQNEKITGIQTRVAMSNLLPATYFLKVEASIKEVKTFKIIKTR